MNSNCRRSIDAPEVQRWCLMGLNPTHRAIVRRTAQSILDAILLDNGSMMHLQWQVVESLAPANYAPWCDSFLGNDVVVLDLSSSLPIPDLSQLRESIERSSSTICLLWCWGASERASLAIQSSGIAHGMIFDLQSLESWLRSAFRHGAWHHAQDNSLLVGIELPNL